VRVSIGKEIPHPNTTKHPIEWVDLYFHPEEEKIPHQVGHIVFTPHGAAAAGPNQGPVFTQPDLVVTLKVTKAGILDALARCNIHGLWEAEQALKLD
jgi:superoxide reductase